MEGQQSVVDECVLESEGIKVGSGGITKEFMCQMIKYMHTISMQELVLVDDPMDVSVWRRDGDVC